MDSAMESEERLKVGLLNRAAAETSSNAKSHEEVKTESDLKDKKQKTEKKKEEEDDKTRTVPFYKLFAFADSFDILLMILGTIGAVCNGLGLPIMTILFGDVIDVFGQNQNSSGVSDKTATHGNGLGFPMTILFGDTIDVFGQNQNTSGVSDKIAKVINSK